MIKFILYVLGAFIIIATALPFIRHDYWWIRIFDFPRLQLLIAAISIAAVFAFFWNTKNMLDNVLLLLLSAAMVYQVSRIFPYTPFARKQVLPSTLGRSDASFSLITSNILKSNRNVEKYLALVKQVDPDMVLVVETDAWWIERLKELGEKYEYAVKCPLENTYGMALYSRLKLVQPKVRFLVEPDVPSIHALVELKSGQLIEFHGLHPKPPFPTQNDESTERDAELLIVGKSAVKSKRPVIVAGDLNDVAWSHTTKLFQSISKLLDPRIGRGMYNTFHADIFFLRFPLDHVFYSNDFKFVEMKRLPAFGSDHFSIYAELSYEPQAPQEQPEPKTTSSDREEAEETIEEARR